MSNSVFSGRMDIIEVGIQGPRGPAGPAFPGGNKGQLLTKKSNEDYDYTWSDNTVVIANRAELPNIGDKTKFYVIKDENATFIWDSNEIKYKCVGKDYNNIQIIDGNFN